MTSSAQNNQVYLDYQATTPIDPHVLDYMVNCWMKDSANPSSKHYAGFEASKLVENSRDKIAELFGIKASEIIFTSGATEAINLLIRGLAHGLQEKGNHIITSKIEHKAVLDTCRYLEDQGYKVSYLDVDSNGFIKLEQLQELITKETILIAIHHGNNEIGVLQPIEKISQIAARYNIHFFSDTVQTAGKINFDSNLFDSFAISSHKVYGPMGVGFLYVDSRWLPSVKKLMHGGSQERGLRPGTHNVQGIAGLSKALDISFETIDFEQQNLLKLRQFIHDELIQNIDGIDFHGDLSKRLPGNLNFSIPGISNELIIKMLSDRFAFSAGSACTSDSNQPSHVITALNKGRDAANGAIRLSLGRQTNQDDVEYFVSEFLSTIQTIKQITHF